MNWDAVQRECLAALGYRLDALADRETPGDTTTRHTPATGERGLRAAVARAARRPVAALPDGIDWEALRGEPGAKRALWPRLRALRLTR